MAFTLIDLAGGAGGAGDINVNIALQEKTVDSSTETQHVVPTDGYIGIKDVIVNPYVLDSSNAVITNNGEYVFESAADGLSRVDVSVNIPGPGAPLQSKTVDSSTKSQLVEPDSGNYGLSSVTVNPYTLDSSSLVATENGEYIITSSADGLSRVDISVNVAGGTLQSKTVDSSTKSQLVEPDSGNYGLSSVTVNPYTLTTSSIDSSTAAQTVTVPTGYNGLSSVTINGLNLDNIYNTLAAY